MAIRIKIRVVDLRNMPRSTVTQPTEAERAILGQWVDGGALYCAQSPTPADVDDPDAGTVTDGGLPTDGGTHETDGGTQVDGGTDLDGGAPVSFAEMVQPIFDRRCTGCHNEFDPPGNLNLADHAYEHLVDVASRCDDSVLRVSAGDPENSMLWRKLGAASDRCGGVMPLGGPGLRAIAPEEFDIIERWIQEGATNN
jgi:hypothetical protein